jgi:hypothetical protein
MGREFPCAIFERFNHRAGSLPHCGIDTGIVEPRHEAAGPDLATLFSYVRIYSIAEVALGHKRTFALRSWMSPSRQF